MNHPADHHLLAPGSDAWRSLFTTFRSSAYRLETLQSYGSSGEDASFAAFLAGETYTRSAGKTWWLDCIAAAHARGASMGRVHVVTEPLTDYMRYEIAWAYAPNVAAGEDIRIVPVGAGQWPDDLPPPGSTTDYWLFDDTELYRMHYGAGAAWLGAQHVTDPDAVAHAREWREAARRRAVPWRAYIAARPDLASRVPHLTS